MNKIKKNAFLLNSLWIFDTDNFYSHNYKALTKTTIMIAYLILLALGATNLFAMDNFLTQVHNSAQSAASTLHTLNQNLTEDVETYRAAKNAAIESAKKAAGWIAWAAGLFRSRAIKSITLPEGNPGALKALLHNHSVFLDQDWERSSNAQGGLLFDYSKEEACKFVARRIEAEQSNKQAEAGLLATCLRSLKKCLDEKEGKLSFDEALLKDKTNSIQEEETILAHEKILFKDIISTKLQDSFYDKQQNIFTLKTDAAKLAEDVDNLKRDICLIKSEIKEHDDKLNLLLKNQQPLPLDPLFAYDYATASRVDLSDIMAKIYRSDCLCLKQYQVDNYTTLVRYGVFYGDTKLEDIYHALCELYPGAIANVDHNFGPMYKVSLALGDIFSHVKVCAVPFQVRPNMNFEDIVKFELNLVSQVAQKIISLRKNEQTEEETKKSIEQEIQEFCLNVFKTENDDFFEKP